MDQVNALGRGRQQKDWTDANQDALEWAQIELHKGLAEYHIRVTIPRIWDFGPKQPPPRPQMIPADDYAVASAVQDAKRGAGTRGAAGQEMEALLRVFGQWRRAVMIVEQRNTGSLIVLLSMLDHFDRAGGDECWEAARNVRDFLEQQYRHTQTETPGGLREIREMAERVARRRDILSDHLLGEGSWIREDTEPPDPARIDAQSIAGYF
jgi:hypothetical protein